MMLWDAFEVIILPLRVTRRLRFARFFYRFTWRLRSSAAQWIRDHDKHVTYFIASSPDSNPAESLRSVGLEGQATRVASAPGFVYRVG